MRGLTPPRIVVVHALRNGAGPAVALLGMHVPKLIGGAVITEKIFSMPGLGSLTKEAALQGDVPVVQGTLLVTIADRRRVVRAVQRPAARHAAGRPAGWCRP